MQKKEFNNVEGGNDIRSYAFIFVCQSGELEAQAALLAASLKRFVKVPGEIIALVPTPEKFMGKPMPQTISFLKKLGVRIASGRNPLVNEKNQKK